MIAGSSDFVYMVKNDLYVDKTDIIFDLVPLLDSGSSIIINRPRRFGKSLMLSMLDNFFNIDKSESRKYFNGLKVANKDLDAYQNKYHVIHLSFKDSSLDTNFDPITYIKILIGEQYKKFYPLFNTLKKDDFEEEKYQKIISGNIDDTYYFLALKDLTKYIYEATKIKPIILIDEYDSLIEKFYRQDRGERVIELLKSIYSSLLKDNEYLGFGFLSGVFSLAKGTLGYGLNNIPIDNGIISLLSDNYFGFTKKEVIQLLDKYHLSKDKIELLEKYYGGYLFNKKEYINPWSTLSFLDSGIISNYWSITANDDLFVKLIEDPKNQKIIDKIVDDESIFMNLDFSISYSELFLNINNILLYLFLAGYLRIKQIDFLTYEIKNVNIETKSTFNNEIIKRYQDVDGLNALYKLKSAFKNGEGDIISQYLSKFILSSLSYFEFKMEKDYQIIIATMSAMLFEDSLIKYEVNAGTGRCDIIILPKNENSYGAVIEIKHYNSRMSKQRLEDASKTALKQIKDKNYFDELVSRNANPIYAFGFAFVNRQVAVSTERIK